MKYISIPLLTALVLLGWARSPRVRTPTAQQQPGETMPVVTFKGTFRMADKKQVLIGLAENQTLSFRRSKKTKFLKGSKEIKPADIPSGSPVVVEATGLPPENLFAVNIVLTESQ
jgi:hypothetical protein